MKQNRYKWSLKIGIKRNSVKIECRICFMLITTYADNKSHTNSILNMWHFFSVHFESYRTQNEVMSFYSFPFSHDVWQFIYNQKFLSERKWKIYYFCYRANDLIDRFLFLFCSLSFGFRKKKFHWMLCFVEILGQKKKTILPLTCNSTLRIDS